MSPDISIDYKFILLKLEQYWRMCQTLYRRYPKVILLLQVGIIFGMFFATIWWNWDPDLGWHVKSGDFIRVAGIPHDALFTYTVSGFRWINHEWLNDVIVSFFNGHVGYLGLSFIFSAIWTGAVYVNVRRYFFITFVAVMALQPYVGVRPLAWTILGLALLIRLTASKNQKLKWTIPIIFFVWANLHGGFVIGLAYLGYLLVKERKLLWLKLLVLSALATLLNPYGPSLYVEISRTLFDSSLHMQISEWAPFYILKASLPYLSLWLIGFWLFANKKRFFELVSFSSLLFLAGLSSSRNVPLFVIASMSEVDEYAYRVKKMIPKKLTAVKKGILGVLLLIMVIYVGVGFYSQYFPKGGSDYYPVAAVSYLKDHPCPGHIFNSYNFGGYLVWMLNNQPVFIDGRMPSWRDNSGKKYFNIYSDVLKYKGYRKTIFKTYNIKCAVLQNARENNKLIHDLKNEGWTAHESSSSVLLINNKH